MQRENKFSSDSLGAHYQTDLYKWLSVHMAGSPAEIKSVAMQEVKYMHKALQDLGHNNKWAQSLCIHCSVFSFALISKWQCIYRENWFLETLYSIIYYTLNC